jgi:hypothetical protein
VVRSPDGASAARGRRRRARLDEVGTRRVMGQWRGGENSGERRWRRRWGALDGDGCGSLHKELGVIALLPAAKKNLNERE